MKVVVKEPKKEPEIREIENDLETLQRIVGGRIEVVRMPFCDDIYIILDEEGKLKGYDPNILFWRRDVIVGTVIFVASTDEDFTDLNEDQIDAAFGYSYMFDYYTKVEEIKWKN